MKESKRKALKGTIKLKTLALLTEITHQHLSNVINNRSQCSKRLAKDLAYHANSLSGQTDFYTWQDFYNA